MENEISFKIAAAAAVIIALSPLVSCQVGLGAAVDTASPTVAITYPPASSVIKGTFVLAGTCSDDRDVSSVNVTVKNTGTGTSYGTYSATVSGGTSWTLSLNSEDTSTTYDLYNSYKKWAFPDGTYKLDVTAYDASGHSSGTSSLSVDIDNTAPVLILSRPLAYGSGTATAYGRSVKLAGDISDDHTVSSLTVNMKLASSSSSTTTLGDLKTLSVTDFSAMSSDNPLVIAKYYTTAEISATADSTTATEMTTLRSNYLSIYGTDADNDSTSDKIYYCGILLSDNAKTYQTVGDSGTGSGNETSVYYINNDSFSDDLISTGTYALTAPKLKTLINGTGSTYTAAQRTAIIAILETAGNYASSSDITAAASSKFSLNPDNNPTYTVSGYETGYANNTKADSTTGFRSYTTGSTLYLSVSAGRDSIYVKPSTVAVKLYKLSSYSDTNYLTDTTSDNIQTILAAGSWTDESALSANYDFVLDTATYALKANGYYRLVVTGEDRDGNELTAACSDGYGFRVKSSYEPPELTYTSPDEDTLYSGTTANASGFTLTGKITTDGLSLASTAPLVLSSLAVTNTSSGSDVSSSISYTAGTPVISGSGSSYTFSLPVTAATSASLVPSATGKYKYKITLTAQDSDGNTTSASIPLYVDNQNPTVSVSSVSPTATSGSDTTEYVNGTITVKGTASDNNELSDVSWKIYKSSDTTKTAVLAASLGAVESPSFTVDTTQLTDSTDYYIALTATDSVGNTATAVRLIHVNQSTDAPVLSLSNANTAIVTATGIKNAYTSSATINNIFGTTSNNTLLGTITDDDGIASVKIAYDTSSSGSYSNTILNKTSIGGSTSYSISNASFSSLAQGLYYIKITVTDSKQDTTGYATLTTGYFAVAVDNGAPSFSDVTPASSVSTYYSGALSVSGTVTDGSGSVTLTAAHVLYTNSSTASGASSSPVFTASSPVFSTGAAWTDSLSLPSSSGQYKVVYTATDAYGQSSTYSIAYSVDADKPVIALSTLDKTAASTANIYLKQASHTFAGTASDSGGSGLSAVTYAVTNSSSTTVATGTASVSSGTWSAAIDMSSFSEGEYSVVFTAADAAGNTTATSGFSFYIDSGAPVLAVTTVAGSAATTLADYYKSSSLTVSGTITETYLSTFTVTSSTGTITVNTQPSSGTNQTWSFTLPSEGAWTDISVKAVDKAGYTTTLSLSTTLDNTAPVFTTDNTTYPDYVNKAAYSASTWYNATSLAISGCYDESVSGIDAVYYQIIPAGSSGTTVMTAANYASTKTGTFSPTDHGTVESYSTTVGSFSSGTNSLYMLAVDKAGNVSSVIERTIKVDLETPSIESSSDTTILSNAQNSITITGTATDDASGVDSVTAYVGSSTYTISSSDTTYGSISIGSSDATNTTWSLVLNKAVLSQQSSGSTVSVYATVKDAAGNSSKVKVASLLIDTTPPTTTIATPAVSSTSTINGTLSVTGTVTEANSPASISLYYATTASTNLSGWTLYKTITAASGTDTSTIDYNASVSDIYSWNMPSFNFNTNSGASSASSGAATIYLLPVAYDEAGNCSITDGSISSGNYSTYSVDMNGDRPVINVTNISANGGVLKYGTSAQLDGTVTDDDSSTSKIVSTFIAASAEITSATLSSDGTEYTCTIGGTSYTFTVSTSDGTTTIANATYGTTYFTASSGDWIYQPASTADGSKSVYFFITDTNSTAFRTANSSTLYQPYIKFKNGTKADNSSVLTYKSDSTAPSIVSGTANYGASSSSLTSTPTGMTTGLVLGGTSRRYAQFIITASDANGIAGMELTAVDSASTSMLSVATAATVGDDTGLSTSNTDSFGETTDSTEAVWTTDALSLASYTTGSVTVTIKVYDQSGLYTSTKFTFVLDNSGPTITVTSPTQTEEVTGSVSMSGIATDSGGSATSTTQWIIPTTTEVAGAATAAATSSAAKAAYLASLSWQGTLASNKTAGVWEFDFDGTSNPLLTDYDSSTYYSSYSNGIYVLPVYFKSTDALGNYTIKEYSVMHNPDADKPKTTITYPTDSDYDSDKEYITLGGTIRVTGTCVIPSGTASVSAVYIQIADSNGNFTYSGSSSDKTTASSTYGCTVVDYSGASISSGWTSDITETNWWGIAATKTSSTWYINLNADGKMDPTTDGTTNDIMIRACAVNSDGKVGSWSTAYSVHIDNTAPTATASLNQYSTTGDPSSLTATATTAYTSDMYLKGDWYLVVKLADESGIKSSTISVKKGTTSLSQGSGYYISSEQTFSSSSGYYLYIPVSTSGSSVTYTVSATDTDSNGHTISPSYSLNIDNTAPTINTLKGNGTALTSSTSIADSNYVYTLSSSVNEEGSGFSKVVFYYMRTSSNVLTSGNECVLDPMIDYSSNSAAKVLLSGLTALPITQGSNTYYLYGKTVSGSSSQSSTQSFTPATSTDITDNSHIRVGGLIYIGGVYRTITAISSSDGTVTFDTDASSTYTTAVFPYAQVVDNTSSETISDYSSDPFTFSNSSDDGDGMPESISKAGTTWTWSGTVHSTHLPDGPVTVVCLAFDDAGNVSETTVSTTVANNPPRLAKMNFGTDLNGDGYYTTDEFEQYDMYSKLGSYQSAVSIATADYQSSAFIIKNKLAVVPEFTGGNGDITMVFSNGATTAGAVTGAGVAATATVSTTGTSATVSTSPFSSVSITKLSADTLSAYTLANTDLESTVSDSNDGTGKSMSFTFWDSTEETNPGYTSQNCVLRVSDFTLDLVDGVSPTTIINSFYWNSSSDNSLYNNSTDNGHIELPADWKNASGYNSSATSGEYDADPKVSGKVNVTGTAYDDQRLSSLWICFDTSSSATPLMSPSSYTAADTYTFTSSGAVNTTTESTTGGSYATDTAFDFGADGAVGSSDTSAHTYYRVATYDSSANTWTTYSNATLGWTFSITKSTLAQSGHSVTWNLTWDSSLISTVAASDVCMRALALDGRATTSATYTGNASSESTATGTNVPYYQMDVVPYITTVTGQSSKLSSLKSNNPSVYGRTALGKYPVNASESILISGFNLGNSSYTATAVLPKSSGTTYDSVSTSHLFSISSTDTSGALTLQVNSVSSLNNMNYNDSAGAYTASGSTGTYTKYSNWYNRAPNNDNNNLLTDDVELSIWSFDSDAAIPISGRIQSPVMDINPKSGMVGFAFINGPLYYSMGGTVGGTEYSYNYWEGSYDFFTSIGFAYDSLGYSYGCAAGGDINSTSADDFSFMTSRWGRAARVQSGSYYQYNSRRLEQIGMSIDGTYTFDKTRIQSPSFATAVHSSSTNVYLAYFDDMNSEIRFRWGTLSANNTATDSLSNGSNPSNTSSNAGNAGNTSFFYDQYGSGSSTNTQVPQTYNISHTSLIAGTTSSYSTGYNAGEYVSLGVVSAEGSTVDDTVVIIWYDATNQQLLYSYNTTPTSIAINTYSRSGWSTPVPVFGSSTGVGQYCKIAVDKNGGIHIAAYDQSNADLVYAYSPSYAVTSSSGFSTCTVDSYGITGSEITLDVALDSSSKPIPYIGYYANSCIKPKVAYKVTTSSNAPAGASDDAFTGAWEVSVLPTTSTVPEDHINVGVWKSSGILAKSNAFTNTNTSGSNAATQSGSSYSATNYGLIYGNGTSNPILGYEIKSGTSGYIETAQIK